MPRAAGTVEQLTAEMSDLNCSH